MTADDRTHSILHGQTAPRAGHGVRILWRCPSCNRPWLQDPRLPHGCRIRLSNEDALRVAREVHATLDDLPRATCRLCCYAAGGELSIDQYGAGDGFGLSWEGVQPPGMHLLGAVFSVAWAERQREMPHPGIVTQPRRLRAFLEWLAALPDVPEDGVMDAETGAHLARTTRPGHGAQGTQGWVWRGIAACLVPCPPLGGLALASLAEAMPPDAPWSRGLFTMQWHVVAHLALQGSLEQGNSPR